MEWIASTVGYGVPTLDAAVDFGLLDEHGQRVGAVARIQSAYPGPVARRRASQTPRHTVTIMPTLDELPDPPERGRASAATLEAAKRLAEEMIDRERRRPRRNARCAEHEDCLADPALGRACLARRA